jgi:DNA-binding NarL/FixJ family response regulator
MSKPMSEPLTQPIRVAVVEDDPGIRRTLEIVLNGAPGYDCGGVFGSAEDALARLEQHLPDIVLMDIQLPGLSGVDCTSELKKRHPELQIIMLTVFEDDELVFDSLAAGASGYLLKRTPPAEILAAIVEVHRGGSPMSSYIARKVVQSFRRPCRDASESLPLSEREREILQQLAKGYRYKEIADTLSISLDTVRTHLRRIYEKLHVHSRTEAVVKFLGR